MEYTIIKVANLIDWLVVGAYKCSDLAFTRQLFVSFFLFSFSTLKIVDLPWNIDYTKHRIYACELSRRGKGTIVHKFNLKDFLLGSPLFFVLIPPLFAPLA